MGYGNGFGYRVYDRIILLCFAYVIYGHLGDGRIGEGHFMGRYVLGGHIFRGYIEEDARV